MRIDCGYQSTRKEGKKMYYKLTIKKIDRETGEEIILFKGNYSSHDECEMIRNRTISHVNKTRYYTSSRIEKRGEDK